MRALAVAIPLLMIAEPMPAQLLMSGPIEYGRAGGEPGEVVRVPLFVTFDLPMTALGSFFNYDAERLEYLRFTTEGSAAAGVNPFAIEYMSYEPGDGLAGFREGGVTQTAFHVPAGVRQHLGQLEFRILAEAQPGEAAVAPVERVPETAGSTGFTLADGGSGVSSRPSAYLAGSVTVAPPSGPRPLADLRCVQFIDRIRLSFRPTGTYDAIEVRRDGRLLATLPGSATGFEEPWPGSGALTYAVTALSAGHVSVAARCALQAVAPTAPVPEDFVCAGRNLAWTNPVQFDRLSLFRDGELLRQLPGDSVSFTDSEAPAGQRVYSLSGELAGFRSPEVHCLDPEMWAVEVGDVQAAPDAKVIEIPVYVTTSAPVRGLGLCLQMDFERFRPLRDRQRALAGTDGFPEPEFFAIGGIGGACHFPAVGIIYDHYAPRQFEKDLPAGLRQLVVKYPFSPVGEFRDGDTFAVFPVGCSFTDRNTQSVSPQRSIPGRIFMGSGAGAVKNLRAGEGSGGGEAGTSAVRLTWENGAAYSGLRIERDGVTLAEIPGASTSYQDQAVAGGFYRYRVTGKKDGVDTFPASVAFSNLRAPGTFLRGDSNRDGRVDLADPIATLAHLFRGAGPLPCDDAADADDDGHLGLSDALMTLGYIFFGQRVLPAPGVALPWFDPTPDGLACRE